MEEIKLKRADILFEILVSEMIFLMTGVSILSILLIKNILTTVSAWICFPLINTIYMEQSAFFQEDQISAFNKQQNRHENLEGFTCILFLFKHVH